MTAGFAIRLLIWIALCMCALAAGTHAQQAGENQTISAKQLVVMIDGRFPTSGALTSGAGIVVGRKGGLVYIATAGHVVRDLMEEAGDIRVQFPDRPGLDVNATIFPASFDKGIDVALLIVPQSEAPEAIATLETFPTARISTDISTGEGVYLFGQPGGRVWSGNRSPEKVQAVRTTEIEVESNTVVPGLSGGAALDEGLRIVGLIVETENGVARSIPIRFLKEIVESGGYPFMLGDAEGTLLTVETNNHLKQLRAMGVEFDAAGFIRSILQRKEQAISIFHQEEPLLDRAGFTSWLVDNQDTFTPEERLNVAHYIGQFDLDHLLDVKKRLNDQIILTRSMLEEAKEKGIDVPKLCEEYNKTDPILLRIGQQDCKDLGSQGAILKALYEIDANFNALEYLDPSGYELQNYIPKWFSQGETPDGVPFVEFQTKESENRLTQCGYSLSRTRFSVWEGKYTIIPDFGNAILPGNAAFNATKRATDSVICYSFFYNGRKNTQHVQCKGEVLLFRNCEKDRLIFIGVRDHLVPEDVKKTLLDRISYRGFLTNDPWMASDTVAGIWPTGNKENAILYLECLGGTVYARSDLYPIIGPLPNRFTMSFDFGGTVHTATFTGQSDVDGEEKYSPYVALMTKPLLASLAGDAGGVKLSIDDRPLGTLTLKASSWAINKAMKECL